MAVRKVGTVPTPPKVKPVIEGEAGKFAGLVGPVRRYVQIAYAYGESEADARADIATPVLALGDPVGVLAFPLHDQTSSTSGGAKIPPGNKHLLPPGAVGGRWPNRSFSAPSTSRTAFT